MIRIIAVILLVSPMHVLADSYVGISAAIPYPSSVELPTVEPAHPVSAAFDADDYSSGSITLNISAGYRWERLYIEAGLMGINDVKSLSVRTGEDATTSYQTKAIRTEDASIIEAKIGFLFPIGTALSLYIESGGHYYEQDASIKTDTVQTLKADGSQTTTSATLGQGTNRDTAIMYGAGLIVRGEGVSMFFGLSDYPGLDINVVRAGIGIDL